IFKMSEDYDLKKSILRYRIQDLKNEKKYVKLLDYAKRYVVLAQENFDDEGLKKGIQLILYSLAKLSLDKELEESIVNESFRKMIPAQLVDSYLSYLYLKQGKYKKLIKSFEKNESGYGNNIQASLLYNVGEAYFREAKLKKAIKYFDQFIQNHSLLTESSNARLRVALSYDMLDRDDEKVSKLYEEAINRSSNPKIRYEARLRFVGYNLTRKLKINAKQKEYLVFLDQSKDEKMVAGKNLQDLLWLIRGRTYLALENYSDGFKYIDTIPLENLSQSKQRTFFGDGAEMLLGLIKNYYDNEDYQKAVKSWEMNHEKYSDKVAQNPHAMFLVSSSYLKLGLDNLFKKYFNQLKSSKNNKIRTFPRWVKFKKEDHLNSLISELEIMNYMNQSRFSLASKLLIKLKANDVSNFSKYYYLAKISYNLEKYTKAIEHFERLLNNEVERGKLTPLQFTSTVQEYAESLYKDKKYTKIINVLTALKKDLNALMDGSTQSELVKKTKIVERFDYLIIESSFVVAIKDFSNVVKMINKFKDDYKESLFTHRLNYLMAKSYINMFEKEKGIELLNNLVNGSDVPDYLKKGAKTELNLMKLKDEAI
ncbi:tetratricopeptide repeat protein, partial [Bacteriovoracaceae bacterium]|nr:tetratricopeptide repeat protein [Bacteriovoracaceae bacterium]